MRRPQAAALAGTFAAVLLATAVPAVAQSASDVVAELRLEPRRLAVGETAQLEIETRGGMFGSLAFEADFQLENLEVVALLGVAESIRIDNGVTRRSFTRHWRLRAREEGHAAVHSVVLDLGGGRKIHLAGAHLDVDPAPAQRPSPGPPPPSPFDRFFGRRAYREPRVLLRAELSPAAPWTGQRTLFSLWIYTQVQVVQMRLRDMPAFPGCWVEEVEVPESAEGEPVRFEGEPFTRKLLLRRALYPLRGERVEIEPVVLDLLVNSPDPGFGSFFTRTRRETLASNRLALAPRPLPPAPPEFSGLVGRARLAATLEPPEVELGGAATLTVELGGDGHLAAVAAPRIDLPPGLTALPSQSGYADPGGEVRRWSWALVPDRPGAWTLPPVAIAYFDPSAGEYRTAQSDPLALAAVPAVPVDAAPAGGGTSDEGRRAEPLRRAWAAGLPVAAVVTLGLGAGLAWRLRRRRGAPASAAEAALELRLAEALAASVPRSAAAALEAGWRDFLAQRWQLPPDTPPHQWPERLRAGGAGERETATLAGLVHDLHYLRYAPQLSSTSDLAGELAARSRTLARSLH